MKAEPQKEHRWLEQLVGEWTFEGECDMGPDKPREKSAGTQSVRSVGGLWIVAEGSTEMPGGGPASMILTLGYDPARQRFVGTWFGSMMTHLWVYEGTLDETGTVLTLDTEGPGFGGDGTMSRYQDVITIRGDGTWTLAGRLHGPDGQWHEFMTSVHRRAA